MSTETHLENKKRRAVRDRMIEIAISNFLESGEKSAAVYTDDYHTPAWNVAVYKRVGFRLRNLKEFEVHQKNHKVILTRRYVDGGLSK